MRILLVNPPNCGRSIPEERYGIDSLKMILRGEPLALEALAGNLDTHDVRIVDLKAEPDAFQDMVTEFRPHIVGITGVTCEANTMVTLASMAKEGVKAHVVVGGVHASNDPHFFNKPDIDYIVVGLGKQSFRELADAIESGGPTDTIPGIARTNPLGKLSFIPRRYSTEDLAEEKPPRYDLVHHYRDEYILKSLNLNIGLVSTAFGCPYRCSFCSVRNITDGRYMTHDPETILRDIRLLGDIPIIRLVDANTFGNITHSRALCRKIQESGIQKGFVADVRSDTVVHHPDLFVEWKKAGLRTVIVGFEETDDKQLERMGKANTGAINSEAIGILHDIGITIIGDFIVSPDYDERQFQGLRDYMEKNPVDLPMLSVLTPLPGTPLYESMKERITNHDLDFYTLTNAVVPTRMDEKVFYENYADLMKSGHARASL
ncbi:MAG: B12-binding domain-containing radical SAM protein [Syntrophus sp. (in: bacteria)]|nr:B12-binding domain-containing radical SAM protein [Syntrophus sp. (in: bacteria)]